MQKFTAVFAICFSCLLLTVHSATLTLATTDATTSSVFPGTTQQGAVAAVSATTASTSLTAPTVALTNAYTVRWTNGLPLNQLYTLTNDASATGAIGAVIVLTLGPQVSLSITNTPTSPATAGTSVANAAAVQGSSTTCGSYFIDCIAGSLTFQMYVPNANSATCIVTINQVAAIVGILQYPTATAPASPYAAVTTAVTNANGATGAATTICGTATANTNTLLYFISTYGSATGTAQTTAYNQVRAAAVAGNLASNTGYYTANLQPSITGTVNAPSTFAASVVTSSKAANKIMVIAGLLTTSIATLFGFIL